MYIQLVCSDCSRCLVFAADSQKLSRQMALRSVEISNQQFYIKITPCQFLNNIHFTNQIYSRWNNTKPHLQPPFCTIVANYPSIQNHLHVKFPITLRVPRVKPTTGGQILFQPHIIDDTTSLCPEGPHKLMTFQHGCPHHCIPPGGMNF